MGAASLMREIVIRLADRLLYTPYLWGGNDPLAGFDCSGFVIELLKSVGRLPKEGDWPAAVLATKWPSADTLQPGCLLFWGSPIIHVEMVYCVNPLLTIGASGGGSKTTDLAAAIAQDSYIKVRPARTGWVKQVDPFK